MRSRYAVLLVIILAVIILAPASIVSATELNQETLKAWDNYIQGTKLHFQERVTGVSPFLWMDQSPDRRERVRHGEILVEPASNDMPVKVPQGLIHDWIGA